MDSDEYETEHTLEEIEDAEDALQQIERFKRDTAEQYALLCKAITAGNDDGAQILLETIDDLFIDFIRDAMEVISHRVERSDYEEHNTMYHGGCI